MIHITLPVTYMFLAAAVDASPPAPKLPHVRRHVLGHQLVEGRCGMIVVPPDTSLANAGGILEAIVLRIIQDLRHKVPRVV